VPFTYNDLVGTTLVAMYDPSSWPDLAELLQELDTLTSPARAAKALRTLRQHLRLNGRAPYEQVLEGFAGVWCLDPINPDSPSAWARAARRADRRDPYFGRPWIWFGSICAQWPGHDSDRYLGPFNRRTANTVLVVGNRNDPATRYQDAVSTSRLLGRGRLLTVAGWGTPPCSCPPAPTPTSAATCSPAACPQGHGLPGGRGPVRRAGAGGELGRGLGPRLPAATGPEGGQAGLRTTPGM